MKNHIYAALFGAMLGCAAYGTICLAQAGQACATGHGGIPCPGYPDKGERTELDMLKQQVAELTARVTALEEQNKETK